MKLDFDDESIDSLDASTLSRAAESRFKLVLFRTLSVFRASLSSAAVSFRSLFFARIFHGLQLLSLFYLQSSLLDSSSTMANFFYVLSFLRMDFVAMTLGVLSPLFFFFLALSVLSVAYIAIPVCKVLKNRPPVLPLFYLFKFLFPAIALPLQIPVTCITIAALKYSGNSFSVEYRQSISFDSFIYKVFAIFIWLSHVLVLVLYEVSTHETRHYALKHNQDSKSSLLPRFLFHCCTYAFCVLHFMVSYTSPVMIDSVIIIMFLSVFVKYLSTLPNYSSSVNFLHLFICFFVSLTALSHSIAAWVHDPNITTVMVLILSPFLSILLRHFFTWFEARSNAPEHLTGPERLLRPYFIEGKETERIKRTLKNCNLTMVMVWKAYNYLGNKRKPKKARKTLTRCIRDNMSFMEEFELAECNKTIEDSSEEETFRFLVLWDITRKAIQDEYILLEDIFTIWKELLSKKPRRNFISELIEETTPKIHHQSERYRAILKEDGRNIDLIFILGSFLTEVCGKQNEGEPLISRGLGYVKFVSRNQDFNFFSPGNGIIIISADLRILYTNFHARKLLNYEPKELENLSLNGIYLPLKNGWKHPDLSSEEDFPFYVLKMSDGNIQFVSYSYKTEYYDFKEYKLISFKQNYDVLEAACLLTTQGVILGATHEFKRRTKKQRLEGQNFLAVFKGSDAVLFDHYRILRFRKNFDLFAIYTIIQGQGFIIVSMISTKFETNRIKRSSYTNEMSMFDIDDIFGATEQQILLEAECHSDEDEGSIDPHFYYQSEISKSIILKSVMNPAPSRSESVFSSRLEFIKKSNEIIDNTFNRMCAFITVFFIGNLLLTAIIVIFYNLNLNQMSSSLLSQAHIAYNAFLVAQASSLSRLIDLNSRGYDLQSVKEFQTEVTDLIDLLKKAEDEIAHAFENSKVGEFQDFYMANQVPLVYLEGSDVITRNKNLPQFSYELRTNLIVLSQNLTLTLDSPSVFFIYINARTQALEHFQRLVEVYDPEIWHYEDYYYLAKIVYLITSLVFLIVGGVWFRHKLAKVQEVFSCLWNSVVKMTENSMKKRHSVLKERLNDLASIRENSQEQLKKHVKEIEPEKIWPRIFIAIAIYFFIYKLSIYFIESFLLENHKELVKDANALTSLLYSQASNSLFAWQSLLELSLLSSPLSIYTLLPQQTPIASPEKDLENQLAQSTYFITHVTDLVSSPALSSLREIRLSYFGENNSYPQIYRLYYDALGFRGDLRELKFASEDQIKSLYMNCKAITQGQVFLMFELIKQVQEQIHLHKTASIASIITLMLISIVYFCSAIVPIILKTKKKVRTLLKFMEINDIRKA